MTAASCSFYNRVTIDKVIAAYERNNYKQIAEYINDVIRKYGEEEPFARK